MPKLHPKKWFIHLQRRGRAHTEEHLEDREKKLDKHTKRAENRVNTSIIFDAAAFKSISVFRLGQEFLRKQQWKVAYEQQKGSDKNHPHSHMVGKRGCLG